MLLGDSSFCGGTSCRDAVCVGVLRNSHSHTMNVSEIDEAKLHACNGQNITNMTFIEIVIRQPPNKAECPTPEIYPGLILCNSELYGNLPGSVTVRQPTSCRWLAQVRSREGQNDGLTWIKPVDNRASFQVSCKGGWVLVQKRTSSSVSFLQKLELAKVLRPQWCRRCQADRT